MKYWGLGKKPEASEFCSRAVQNYRDEKRSLGKFQKIIHALDCNAGIFCFLFHGFRRCAFWNTANGRTLWFGLDFVSQQPLWLAWQKSAFGDWHFLRTNVANSLFCTREKQNLGFRAHFSFGGRFRSHILELLETTVCFPTSFSTIFLGSCVLFCFRAVTFLLFETILFSRMLHTEGFAFQWNSFFW